jgi:hypothetical protein
MDVTQKQLQNLAQKLLEVFSYQDTRRRGFERYWPLAGPVGTFSENAVTELEQGMAKALQNALEEALHRQVTRSFHIGRDAGNSGDRTSNAGVSSKSFDNCGLINFRRAEGCMACNVMQSRKRKAP